MKISKRWMSAAARVSWLSLAFSAVLLVGQVAYSQAPDSDAEPAEAEESDAADVEEEEPGTPPDDVTFAPADEESTGGEPSDDQPASDESASDEPSDEQPATDEIPPEQNVDEQPGSSQIDRDPASVSRTTEPPSQQLGIELEDANGSLEVLAVVPDSPADAAGLRPGDEIQGVNGQEIGTQQELAEMLADYDDSRISLDVQRGDRQVTVDLELSEPLATEDDAASAPRARTGPGRARAGDASDRSQGPGSVRRRPTEGEQRRAALGITVEESEPGSVVVGGVFEGSPAAGAGIQPGDVIRSINGDAIESSNDVQSLVRTSRIGDLLTMVVERNGGRRTLRVTLAAREEALASAPPSLPGEPGEGLSNRQRGGGAEGRSLETDIQRIIETLEALEEKVSALTADVQELRSQLNGAGAPATGEGNFEPSAPAEDEPESVDESSVDESTGEDPSP